MSKTSAGGDLHPDEITIDDFAEIASAAMKAAIEDVDGDIFGAVSEAMDEFKDALVARDKDGQPITFAEWAVKMEDRDYAVIKQTIIDRGTYEIMVSSVWTGLPPMIFETKVFGPPGHASNLGEHDTRYAAITVVEETHDHIVTKLLLGDA